MQKVGFSDSDTADFGTFLHYIVIGKFRLLLFFQQSTIPIIIILGIVGNGVEIRCIRWNYRDIAEVTYYLYWVLWWYVVPLYYILCHPSPPSSLHPTYQSEGEKKRKGKRLKPDAIDLIMVDTDPPTAGTRSFSPYI